MLKIVTIPAKANGCIFLILRQIVTLKYESHLHAYKVKLNEGHFLVRQQAELVTYNPIHICRSIDHNDNGKYVCPKYDIDIYN